MPKIKRRPVRSAKPETNPPPSGAPKPTERAKGKRKAQSRAEDKATPERRPRAQKPPPPPPAPPTPCPSRLLGGRPRTLDDPCKVLVTLEQCDVDALEVWRARRGYPHRSAAVRAMIAEVCRHG